MTLPPLLLLPSERDYRSHFRESYSRGPEIVTLDGMKIKFHDNQFSHAFYRTDRQSRRKTTTADYDRMKRMDWIRAIATSDTTDVYRRTMPNGHIRRIMIDPLSCYAVVCEQLTTNPEAAVFITAYLPGVGALEKMRANPEW